MAQSCRRRCVVRLLPMLEVQPPPCLLRTSLMLRHVAVLLRPPLVSGNLRPLQRNACLPGLVPTKVNMTEEVEEGDNSEASPRRLKNTTKNNATAAV